MSGRLTTGLKSMRRNARLPLIREGGSRRGEGSEIRLACLSLRTCIRNTMHHAPKLNGKYYIVTDFL